MGSMLWLVLALLLAGPARAGDAGVEAERHRLEQQMQSLARKNAWSGVERTYAELAALGGQVPRPALLLAAEAARLRGDVLSRIARLVEAQSLQDDPTLDGTVDDLIATFGRVQLVGTETLTAAVPPFRADAQQAIVYATEQLAAEGRFDGFLPAGDYTFGERTFTVVPGAEPVVISAADPGAAGVDLTVAGVEIPPRATVGGRRLKLNGVGVRTKLGVSVYVGALYVREPTDDAFALARQDLPKRLLMHFVFRRTPRAALVDFFDEGLRRVPGAAGVEAEIATFVGLFDDDLHAGEQVVLDYVPGEGTTITIAGRTRATIAGKAFMWVLFGLFLGDDPPTKKLKAGLQGLGG